MKKYLSWTELLVIGLTIILFVVALFVKGLTKDLLLEGGVLLVSVKLILMNHKSAENNKKLHKELTEIKEILAKQSQISEPQKPQ